MKMDTEDKKIHRFLVGLRKSWKKQGTGDILSSWLREGQDRISGTDMPKHPEFIYRLSGEWEGWSDFLGSDTDHSARDKMENEAFIFYKEIL
jgi:hypothetical protein